MPPRATLLCAKAWSFASHSRTRGASETSLESTVQYNGQIGRYVIRGELGRGAMGIVYDAVDPMIGRRVAVKVISLKAGAEPRQAEVMKERLFREAQIRRPPVSSRHRRHPGCRAARRFGLHHDGAHRWPVAVPVARVGRATGSRAGHLHPETNGRGARLRAPVRRGSSRHQAGQHHAAGRRHREGGGFWRRQADVGAQSDRDGRAHGHSQLYVSRAD